MEINSASNLYNNFDASSAYGSENAVNKAEAKAAETELSVAKDAFTPSKDNEGDAFGKENIAGSVLRRVKGVFKEPCTVTQADKYGDGSDVREMAYKMACEDERYSVNLSNFPVVKANDDNNVIKLHQDSKGILHVNVDGKDSFFRQSTCKRLIIDGGGGDDTIIADDTVTNNLHIVGGKGSDRIKGGAGDDYIIDNYGSNYILAGGGNDQIIADQFDLNPNARPQTVKGEGGSVSVSGNYIDGGDGNDYIEGGKGDDYLVGGRGKDVIYGLDGNDRISGGDGRDYLDGGRGDDKILAGSGNDMLFGGSGDDSIKGGEGDNVIVGGRGNDKIDGGGGRNRITTDGSDTVADGDNSTVTVSPMEIPGNITVGGVDDVHKMSIRHSDYIPSEQEAVFTQEAFKMRAESDLETLSSISEGQKLLNGLADMNGRTVDIAGTDSGSYCMHDDKKANLNEDGTANKGSSSEVAYSRSCIDVGNGKDWGEFPPIVGLYHEMSHSYDAGKGILDARMYNYNGTVADGTGDDPGEVKGCELQAMGIDIGAKELIQNPDGINEKSIRNFLGIEQRNEY